MFLQPKIWWDIGLENFLRQEHSGDMEKLSSVRWRRHKRSLLLRSKNMDIKAEQKYLLISPKKVRVVVEMIKRLRPSYAVENLSLIGKAAAEPLRKVILSAIANAKVKGISEDALSFKEIQVGEGPRLKRGQPVSRGQWHPVKKRMSHIKVILETKEVEKKGGDPTSRNASRGDIAHVTKN
ncbi:50S ribosomal protein L22 [Candidatus Woesebacteria bacterium CG22_combo_CG10-13_8_21_14_all_39_10]|uniref:Large ribosomal subunit protein uL22 n=1 Tax=Candidatus Woesebacteria bacterium CG22_combo_CG10-13_8_21_14_all_39_10 TaxID=1975059 RepID=A0A2H0BKP5_9BACT|nr:MAG: 50S ribosomal protein L22 [Candidatus Woesebacteria bacterium CG22_combo_CG10-13_8_21_14_all_39_10]